MKVDPVKSTVATNFEVVHVDLGNWDKNASVRIVSSNGEFAGASAMAKNELNQPL